VTSGQVRVSSEVVGSPSDCLDELAEELRQHGFTATVKPPPSPPPPPPPPPDAAPALPLLLPWHVVQVILDETPDAASIGAVIATIVMWAKKRWKDKKDKDENSVEHEDHLVQIHGPNGEVLKSVYVEDNKTHELSSRRDLRRAEKRAWKRARKRLKQLGDD
jgi:hypothetical protein